MPFPGRHGISLQPISYARGTRNWFRVTDLFLPAIVLHRRYLVRSDFFGKLIMVRPPRS
jgi:hypothetical protein